MTEQQVAPSFEDLCSEFRALSQQVEELTRKKELLKEQIISQMKEKTVSTARFKVTKIQQIIVKTDLESARSLKCTLVREDIDKEALRKLYLNGIQVPDIHHSEYIRITELRE